MATSKDILFEKKNTSDISNEILENYNLYKAYNPHVKLCNNMSEIEDAPIEILEQINSFLIKNIKLKMVFDKMTSQEKGSGFDHMKMFSAVAEHGLTFVDFEFFKKISFYDEVIEIYDIQSFKQIYSNNVFSKLCSYTLFDLFMYPFFKLFSRPAIVEKELMTFFEKAKSLTGISKLEMSDHILSEIRGTSKTNFRYSPNIAMALKNKNTGENTHLAFSAKVSINLQSI